MINVYLSLGDFFEHYQTLAILMCLGMILLLAFYIKKNFPKWFDDNKEELKTQEEIDKEEFENLIQHQPIEEKVVEEEEDEEEVYFINNNNRDSINKMKNKK